MLNASNNKKKKKRFFSYPCVVRPSYDYPYLRHLIQKKPQESFDMYHLKDRSSLRAKLEAEHVLTTTPALIIATDACICSEKPGGHPAAASVPPLSRCCPSTPDL